MDKKPSQKSIIVVLGMHRSGTSVVTRIFNILGADTGVNLMAPADDNPAGFWEPVDIVAVHDELLQHLGYSWEDPRPLPYKWWQGSDIKEFENRLLELAKRHYSNIDLPIIKDPRLCRLLPLWNKIFDRLGWKPHYILVGRSPLEVAASLATRNTISANQSHLLWLRHVLESELWSRKYPRTVLLYSQLFQNWQSEIKRCKRELGLKKLRFSKSRESEVNDLIDQDLQHSTVPSGVVETAAELSLFVSDAYHQIQQCTIDELVEDKLQSQFDTINQQLSNADSFYSSIWLSYLKQRDVAITSVLELENQYKASQADLEHYRGLASGLESQHEGLLDKVQSLATRVGEEDVLKKEFDRQYEGFLSSKTEYERYRSESEAHTKILTAETHEVKQKLENNSVQIGRLQNEKQEAKERMAKQDAELVSTRNMANERDEKIKELTGETVRRGEWGMDLDRQLKDAHDQIKQITNSPSWKMTLPLRELRRWVDRPVSQSKQYIRLIAKSSNELYERLPLSSPTKLEHKQFLIKYAPWVLRAAGCYPESEKDISIPDQIDDSVSDYAKEANNIRLDTTSEPMVSVIIPVYGKCEYTIRCLASIEKNSPNVSFEVIVVDDCSPDNTVDVLSKIHSIRLIKNDVNLGFIRTCNHGADEAKGQFLLFLNNDTVVLPDWLDELKRTFDDNEKVGLVGSKLIYPDGKLQEAGGIIWRDGSGWNYGRNDDPEKPDYSYLREVDYCSGASIMVPRELFFEVGCFDERYIPAYYEDTDLAFSLRELGYRVLYQPLSKIIHYEGISSGTDLNSGVKKYQIDNGKKFYEKWKHILAEHSENGNAPDYEKERSVEKRILVVDAVTPTPDKDSGSVDVQSYFTILVSLGYKITFIPADNFQNVEGYTRSLQRQGVECLYFPFNKTVLSHLKQRGDEYNVVMLYRADYASLYIDDVRKYCTNAVIIFNTVDLHFLRMQRQAEIENSELIRREAKKYKEMELTLMEKTDKTIILSKVELNLLKKEGVKKEKLFIVPLIREIPGRSNTYSKREGIVFVGGFQHQPNVDAIFYFCKEIWPLIRKEMPTVNFYIVGSNMPENIKNMDVAGVHPIGFVEDLSEYFDSKKLSVAPLRYGAGLKGKVGASLAYGLPCVATPIAVEGAGLLDKEHLLVEENPDDFSRAICELYNNEELWNTLSDKGLEFVNNEYSIEAGQSRIMKVLN